MDESGDLVFDIPVERLQKWLETPLLGRNHGLLLTTQGSGHARVFAQERQAHGAPELEIEGTWEADQDLYQAMSGELKVLGSGGLHARLMEKILAPEMQVYNPGIRDQEKKSRYEVFVRDNVPRGLTFFKPTCERLLQGNGDIMLTSRRDWQHFATEEWKQQLTYKPIAKQEVHRSGELVGGVEFGIVYRTDAWIPQVQAFLDFVDTSLVHEALQKDQGFDYVPVDTELPEFERPDYWSEEPWNDEKPRMVHGMDMHGRYRTTMMAEINKVMMEGYNSILPPPDLAPAVDEAVMNWADENGMMLSGFPRVTKKDREGGELSYHAAAARILAEHPSCRGAFLVNEDAPGGWLVQMYKDKYHGNMKNKYPERVEAFKQGAQGGFTEWVKEKHGNLDTLNERWDTDYESWDDVGLPSLRLDEIEQIYGAENKDFQYSLRVGKLMTQHPELLDVYRFNRELWASWYDERIAEMRPYLGDDFRYSTKDGKDPYAHRASDEFNCASHDHGPGKYAPVVDQILVDTVQTPLDWTVWNSEDHMYNWAESTPRRIRYDVFSHYLMGQFQDTVYVWWRANRKTARDRHAADVRIRDQIRRNEDIFRAFMEARANAELAVLVTEGNRAWDEYFPRPEEVELGGAVKAFAYMGALGKQWKYVLDYDISAEAIQDVLVIDAPWLTREATRKLAALPSDREIIAVGSLPTKDEYGQPLPEDELQAIREQTEVVEDWLAVQEKISPAEGLSAPYTQVSQAKFWTWNRFRGPAHGKWYFKLPVPRLEVRKVQHDGKLYLGILNHADRAITAPIPWSEGHTVRELTSDAPDEVIQNTDAYQFGREGVGLFEIQ